MYLSFQVLEKNQKNKNVALMIIDREIKEKGIQHYVIEEMKLEEVKNGTEKIWTAKVYFPFDDPKEFDNAVDKYKPWFVEEMKKRGIKEVK